MRPPFDRPNMPLLYNSAKPKYGYQHNMAMLSLSTVGLVKGKQLHSSALHDLSSLTPVQYAVNSTHCLAGAFGVHR